MRIRILNCFTCNAHVPKEWETGLASLLIETNQGLTLVDTGLGLDDYANPTWFTQFFRVITVMPFDPQEAAVNQIQKLGYAPEDVKHIILTHMHFDHCGGLPDFPHAKIHVHKKEHDAFINGKGFLRAAYVKRHIAHQPDFVLYEDTGEKWFDFNAIRISDIEPEIYLVPMPYHTPGLCGVAVKTDTGWLLHCADAAADFRKTNIPEWSIRFILGPYMPRLREFASKHPEVQILASHMFKDFFHPKQSAT